MPLPTEAPRPSRRTVPPPDRPRFERREVLCSRFVAVGMAVLVAAGLSGFLGPSERTSSRTGPAGTLEATHPSLTRPGLDSALEVTLRPEVEPAEPFRLVVPSDVFATLGLELVQPEPTEESVDGANVVLHFDPAAAGADGELVVTMSGRMPTKQPPGRHGWQVEWRTDDGSLRTPMTTWVLP